MKFFIVALCLSLPNIGQSQTAFDDMSVGDEARYFSSFGSVSRIYAGKFGENYVFGSTITLADNAGTDYIMSIHNADRQQIEYQTSTVTSIYEPHDCWLVEGSCTYRRIGREASGKEVFSIKIERRTVVLGDMVYFNERDPEDPEILVREACAKVDENKAMILSRDMNVGYSSAWYLRDDGRLPAGVAAMDFVNAACPHPFTALSSQ